MCVAPHCIPPQVVAPGPPTIGGSDVNPLYLNSTGNISLTADNVSCNAELCTQFWNVICDQGGPNITANGTRIHQLSVGIGPAFDLNLLNLKNYSCSAQYIVRDVIGQEATTALVTFQVGGALLVARIGCGAEASLDGARHAPGWRPRPVQQR